MGSSSPGISRGGWPTNRYPAKSAAAFVRVAECMAASLGVGCIDNLGGDLMAIRSPSPVSCLWFLVALGCVLLQGALFAQDSVHSTNEDWPYPNKDLRNTAALSHSFDAPLQAPVLRWQIEAVAPHRYIAGRGTHVVISDVDADDAFEILVAQGAGYSAPQQLVCLALEDAQQEWRFALGDGENVQWASPNIVDLDGDEIPEVVLGAGERIVVLDGASGRLRWQRTIPVPMCLGAGAFSQGESSDIFSSSFLEEKLCYRLDGGSGEILWSSPSGGSSAYNVPALADLDGDGISEILFHVHDHYPSREMEVCMASSGDVLWRFEASPSSDQTEQAPPELGWTPDYGYVSTMVGDFWGTGQQDAFFATRCNAYLLSPTGQSHWTTPLAHGNGIMIVRDAEGNESVDIHGTGGEHDAAAAGDLNGDGALDVVLGLDPEYRAVWDRSDQTTTYTDVRRNNRTLVLNGKTGEMLWDFEGQYPSENGLERMGQPILIDLDANGLLDVVVASTDGSLYGLRGTDGAVLWTVPLSSANAFLVAGCVFDGTAQLLVISYDEDMRSSKLSCYLMEGTEEE